MKVITAEPLSIIEMIEITGRDALCNLEGNKVRIMNFARDHEVECCKVIESHEKRWGLRKANNGKGSYDYIAFVIKEEN